MKIKFPLIYNPQKSTKFVLGENESEEDDANYQHNEGGPILSGYYSVDLSALKKQFGMEESSDVKLREFTVSVAGQSVDACVFFIDGLTDKDLLNDFILEPLMIQSRKIEIKNANEIPDILLPQGECSFEDKIDSLAFALITAARLCLSTGWTRQRQST